MKTTYEIGPARLKKAIEAYMASIGKPVTDADVFTVAADGTVTVVITEPDDAAPSVMSPPATLPLVVTPIPAISATTPKGDFEKAFQFVIKWEGSEYEDVSGDPGGPTKYGIDSKDHPSVDIKGLTLENAKQIYLTDYWRASDCDNLPSPVAETHFNFAVNTGREQSVKFMQRTLGLAVDGQFGSITAAVLAALTPASVRTVALGMIDQADAFYKDLAAKGMDKFLKGWLNRNNALRSFIG
jgi:Glycosyl hydrolase 108/Predicted Peptidoglycan domain